MGNTKGPRRILCPQLRVWSAQSHPGHPQPRGKSSTTSDLWDGEGPAAPPKAEELSQHLLPVPHLVLNKLLSRETTGFVTRVGNGPHHPQCGVNRRWDPLLFHLSRDLHSTAFISASPEKAPVLQLQSICAFMDDGYCHAMRILGESGNFSTNNS